MNQSYPSDARHKDERALIEAARQQASAALAVPEPEIVSFSAFHTAVQQSDLVSPADLKTITQQIEQGSPGPKLTGDRLARHLVAANLLTQYQADRILAGHTAGWRFGDCVILDRLGSGGMGKVYLANQVKLGRTVALKVLSPALAKDAEFLARFRREARIVAQLQHPNIVQVFDVGEEAGVHFIVMELVRGANLAERIQQVGPLSIQDSSRVVRQVALGLQHAYENGLVHRDVKPANLIVDATVVKILDLGLARPLTSGQTITGDVGLLGTPDYMSPEQFENPSAVDIRSDLYALGCTWYTLLTGAPPFADCNLLVKNLAHQNENPPAVSDLVAALPEEVAALIHRMLAKSPGDRFSTPADLIQAIDAIPDFAESLTDRIPLTMVVGRYKRHASRVPLAGRQRLDPRFTFASARGNEKQAPAGIFGVEQPAESSVDGECGGLVRIGDFGGTAVGLDAIDSLLRAGATSHVDQTIHGIEQCGLTTFERHGLTQDPAVFDDVDGTGSGLAVEHFDRRQISPGVVLVERRIAERIDILNNLVTLIQLEGEIRADAVLARDTLPILVQKILGDIAIGVTRIGDWLKQLINLKQGLRLRRGNREYAAILADRANDLSKVVVLNRFLESAWINFGCHTMGDIVEEPSLRQVGFANRCEITIEIVGKLRGASGWIHNATRLCPKTAIG